MKTQKSLEERLVELGARERSALWENTKVSPEELVKLDPLDITYEVLQRAENPQYAYACVREIPMPRPKRVDWIPR